MGRPGPGGSLGSQPQSAVDRSRLRLHLATKTCHTTCFAKGWLRTFVATAYGSRCSSARAVAQRRSDHAPRASQPWPQNGTPAEKERKRRKVAAADGRPGQHHPSNTFREKNQKEEQSNRSMRAAKSSLGHSLLDKIFAVICRRRLPRSLSDIRKHENFSARIWLRMNDLDSINMISSPQTDQFRQCRTGS